MGAALETISGHATGQTGLTTFAAQTMATGDSAVIRNFPAANPAYLMAMLCGDAEAECFRVRSPLLHDNVMGIHVNVAETPSGWALGAPGVQQLKPQDSLILEQAGVGTAVAQNGISIYYTNLPGSAARLHNYGDFRGMIKNIFTVDVLAISTGSPNAWTDTAINGVENLLHANEDYAVLGMWSNVATGIIALKGIDTGNVRVGAPASTRMFEQSEYFIILSNRSGLPCIPVFNAANAPSTYVSCITAASTSNANITLLLAELGTNTGL
jgi:hypothetical protein